MSRASLNLPTTGAVCGIDSIWREPHGIEAGAWYSQRHGTAMRTNSSGCSRRADADHDAGEEILSAGDCAAFRSGDPDGQSLETNLAAGQGARDRHDHPQDRCTYPDIDMIADHRGYTHRDGTPYPLRNRIDCGKEVLRRLERPRTGVFSDWPDAHAQVDKFPGARFKSFPAGPKRKGHFVRQTARSGTGAAHREPGHHGQNKDPDADRAPRCASMRRRVRAEPGQCRPGSPYTAGVTPAIVVWPLPPQRPNNTAELKALHHDC